MTKLGKTSLSCNFIWFYSIFGLLALGGVCGEISVNNQFWDHPSHSWGFVPEIVQTPILDRSVAEKISQSKPQKFAFLRPFSGNLPKL